MAISVGVWPAGSHDFSITARHAIKVSGPQLYLPTGRQPSVGIQHSTSFSVPPDCDQQLGSGSGDYNKSSSTNIGSRPLENFDIQSTQEPKISGLETVHLLGDGSASSSIGDGPVLRVGEGGNQHNPPPASHHSHPLHPTPDTRGRARGDHTKAGLS